MALAKQRKRQALNITQLQVQEDNKEVARVLLVYHFFKRLDYLLKKINSLKDH